MKKDHVQNLVEYIINLTPEQVDRAIARLDEWKAAIAKEASA